MARRGITIIYPQIKKHRRFGSVAWHAEGEVWAARSKSRHQEMVVKAVSQAIPAIVMCNEGTHHLCKKYSFVCDGEQNVYEYVPKFAQGAFRFAGQDVKILLAILQKRMGKEALLKTRFGFTIQKVECTNHAFIKTNPKHSMICSRNGINRDHSAIHAVNN